MEKEKILIVDDDKNICRLIGLYLENEGYETTCCHDGSAAIDFIHKDNFTLVILDLMIPYINGWEVCKMIKMEKEIPIIMVSARDLIEDKINGFEVGTDDYIVKPFEPKELVARVKARIKNYKKTECVKEKQIIKIDNLSVNLDQYEVQVDHKIIELKPKETQLLYFLMENKNIVFTREQLLDKIWDYSYPGDTRTVDVHIKCLRKKLNNNSNHWRIKTIWGVGYKLEVH